MFSEIPVFISRWHFSPRNLIDRVHINQTKLISSLSPPLKAWGPHRESEWRFLSVGEESAWAEDRRAFALGSLAQKSERQEDTSLLIYYQVSLLPLRKALAFLIFDDSHLPSIFFPPHFVSPNWKEKFIQGLICEGESEERVCVGGDLPLPFGSLNACDRHYFKTVAKRMSRTRGTHIQTTCPDVPSWWLEAFTNEIPHTAFRHPSPMLLFSGFRSVPQLWRAEELRSALLDLSTGTWLTR